MDKSPQLPRLSITGQQLLDAATAFESARYMGTWYERARIPFEKTGTLVKVRADYSGLRAEQGKLVFDIVNTSTDPADGTQRRAHALAVQESARSARRFRVKFDFMPVPGIYEIVSFGHAAPRSAGLMRWALVTNGASRDWSDASLLVWLLTRRSDDDEAVAIAEREIKRLFYDGDTDTDVSDDRLAARLQKTSQKWPSAA